MSINIPGYFFIPGEVWVWERFQKSFSLYGSSACVEENFHSGLHGFCTISVSAPPLR
jgi:hypothetical protein